jgi:predicted AlkP superfamily phosphohydrolase/phosphomutase
VKPKSKVLVIGLDGADFDLIEPWIKDGTLPNIRKIYKEGIHGTLKSCFPPGSSPAWKCFSTGKNPGKLDIYSFRVLKSDSYKPSIVNSKSFHEEEIWDIIGKYGLKSGVLYMITTYPPKEINGFMISGILTPSEKHEFTHPKELKKEIYKVANYKIKPETNHTWNSKKFMQEHFKDFRIKTKIAKYLMENKEWDFLLIVFQEIDYIQHFMWKHMDKTHPLYTKKGYEEYGHVIKECWKELDRNIGQIIDGLPSYVTLFVMSDHGFGKLDRVFNVNDWLIQEGFLKLNSKTKLSLLNRFGISKENVRRFLQILKLYSLILNILPRNFLKKIADKLPSDEGGIFLENADIDWQNTMAFSIGDRGPIGQIYFNKKGRPCGIVPEGKECEILFKKIEQKLYQLKDPNTGKTLEVKVFRPRDLYKGALQNAPDMLFAIENMDISVNSRIGHKSLFYIEKINSGSHRENGILIVKGPNIKRNKVIYGAEIVDLAPTILHIFNIPIPKDMDGRVLKELFDEKSEVFKREIIYQDPREKTKEEKFVIEEEKKIQKRLEELGYM